MTSLPELALVGLIASVAGRMRPAECAGILIVVRKEIFVGLDEKLEKWRKEIKVAIRLDFIEGRVDIVHDPKKKAVKVVICYTENDKRCRTESEFSLNTLEKNAENKPIEWRNILSKMIEKYGKNRQPGDATMSEKKPSGIIKARITEY